MSTDWGDLSNDGHLELFSTDMNPYDISPQTLAKWLPMMTKMGDKREANDPQLMSNVLLVADGAGRQGRWHDDATARGVSASGWSWAGRLGDLDRDGYLDLYVVNGMIATDLFGYLPNAELVEAEPGISQPRRRLVCDGARMAAGLDEQRARHGDGRSRRRRRP